MSSQKTDLLSIAGEIRALNTAWLNLASRMAKESPAECKIILGLKQDEVKYLAELSSIDIAANSVESVVTFKPRISLKKSASCGLTSRDYASMINRN